MSQDEKNEQITPDAKPISRSHTQIGGQKRLMSEQ